MASVGLKAFAALQILSIVSALTLQDLLPRDAPTAEDVRDNIPQDRPSTLFFLGIKSGTHKDYVARRQLWRDSGCANKYQRNGISWAFFVGVPVDAHHDLTGHSQDSKGTPEEQEMALSLLEESKTHKDIQFVAFREQYQDLSNKLVTIFRHGLFQTNSTYFVEHDDEFCADPDSLLKTVAEFEQEKSSPQEELWGGAYWFNGDEYASMAGADGSTAGYVSGWGCVMSRGLARYVFDIDYAHTLLNAPYGTNADDANLGKWVQYAKEEHKLTVIVKPTMILDEVARMKPFASLLDAGAKSPEVRPEIRTATMQKEATRHQVTIDSSAQQIEDRRLIDRKSVV